MKSVAISVFAALCLTGAAMAQQSGGDTVEKLASADEATKVKAVLAKIGCKAEQVEKESDKLFEIDDAECEIGQYDIKVNSDYKIVSITLDE
jgi:hypothetical protein